MRSVRAQSLATLVTIAAAVAGMAALVLGVFLGTIFLVGLAPLILAVAGAAMLVAWTFVIVNAFRRASGYRRSAVWLVIGTACCVALAAVAYVGVWLPFRLSRSIDFYERATPEQLRALYHRNLLWSTDPHDEFIRLMEVGDESSVPYIIWALRWMPEHGEHGMVCTWWHGLEALEKITNHSPGPTRRAWQEWYEVNSGRSQLQWWCDGFAAEGYPVTAEGGEESTRNLLKVLGRTAWDEPDWKKRLAFNARRMLGLFGASQVRAVCLDVLREGTIEERRGLARYAADLPRAEADSILPALAADRDPSVRLCAEGVLAKRRELEELDSSSDESEE